MSEKIPFSNEPEKKQRTPEQQERDLHLEQNRERFIAECVEQAEELSDARVAVVSEYLRTHSGTWQSYDDDQVYVSSAGIEGDRWHVEFGIIDSHGEKEEFSLHSEWIPLS